MGNYTSTDLGIAVGPSLAGAFILMAAIIGAVVFFVKERQRRKECQKSVSSSASLVRGGIIIPHFRIPTFNHSPSPGNFRRDYHNTSAHLVQPWTGNGKVFTIPVTPSDSSKTSTIDSQSDRSYVNAIQTKVKDTVTEKFYYDFHTTINHTSKTSNNNNNNNPSTIPSTTTNTTNNSSNSDNSKPNQATAATTTTNNSNTNQATTTTTSTNTPAISSTTLETPSGDQVVMRRSREVSKMVKSETPIRSTILTEDAWNSTLDDIFNSALSLHEKGTQNNLVNVRGTVFPLMN